MKWGEVIEHRYFRSYKPLFVIGIAARADSHKTKIQRFERSKEMSTMQDQAADMAMSEKGVFFLPWIGTDYKKGFHGCRVLVVAESHYTDWNDERHALDSGWTRHCVVDAVERPGDGSPLYGKIEKALLGPQLVLARTPSNASSVWDKIAFYNFVQSPVIGGPGIRPSAQDFKASWPAFRGVLETLRPDRTLIIGKELWRRMDVEQPAEYLHDLVQSFRLADGSDVWCFATPHTAARPPNVFDPIRLHQQILAFFSNPRKLASQLRANAEDTRGELGRALYGHGTSLGRV